MNVAQLEPEAVWRHFVALSEIPRESLDEGAAAEHVKNLADSWGYSWQQDRKGNVVVCKPASPGRYNHPTIVLQAHLDMVCEQDRGGDHNFKEDPIIPVIDGDWVRAEGTTLGADDGIGCAVILAILEDQSLHHGPLEALFTVDEELEMTGAAELDPLMVSGRLLLNLDGEGQGRFCVGSAGGCTTHLSLPLGLSHPDGEKAWSVFLSGFEGGHSGVSIHRESGNALALLARGCSEFFSAQPPGTWQLVRLDGGDKDNAIPREAEVHLVGPDRGDILQSWFQDFVATLREELGRAGRDLQIAVHSHPLPRRVLTPASQQTFLDLLTLIPQGVVAQSKVVPGLVESSANLGRVRVHDGVAEIVASQRSGSPSALDELIRRTGSVARLAGASMTLSPVYPPWPARSDSELAILLPTLWKERYGEIAHLETVHAGLECGWFAQHLPGTDLISLGAELKDIHTPRERVEISSVARFYDFTKAILEAL